jgi:hypothetical protein
MVRLKEFIQVEHIEDIQREIAELNNELLFAMKRTDIVRDLIVEKNELMNNASHISEMLLPEVKALNSFMGGGSETNETTAITPQISHAIKVPRTIRKGRPKVAKVVAKRAPRIPKVISDAVPLRKRGRPRKTPVAKTTAKRGRPRKATQKVEVAERLNPLDELRRNLAKLRDE